MTITGVNIISVPVSDQDRARDFYVTVLQFELLDDVAMGPDMRWLRVRPPESEVSLTLVTWFSSMPAGSLKGLVLRTSDVDHEFARLTAAGIEVPGGIQSAPWGRYIEIADPDGNGLIIQGEP